MSDNGMVQCRVCKMWWDYITHTHLKQHGMTCADYQEEYPEAPMQGSNFVDFRVSPLRDRVQSEETIDRRMEGLRQWWDSTEGLAQRKDMSDHPLRSRR